MIKGWVNDLCEESVAGKTPSYNEPAQFRGDWEECYLCGGEKLVWHDTGLCVECDNREDLRGTWFIHFAETEGA
jgi:hypothetical protein